MREKKVITLTHYKKHRVIMFIVLLLFAGMGMAESGMIHLIYTNGQITQTGDVSYFEFDIDVYISDGSDVLGAGMVYIQYPTDIFGDIVIMDQKVSVEKRGILAAYDTALASDLYTIVNVTDTYSDVFAVTFMSMSSMSSIKSLYPLISDDPLSPSGLLHVSMQISGEGEGTLLFPSYIPGIQSIYYDYENDVFEGGLDISETYLQIDATSGSDTTVVEPDPDPNPIEDPIFTGNVSLKSFTSRVKRSVVDLEWKVSNEQDIKEYIVERSENGLDFEAVDHVVYSSYEGKFNAYTLRDIYAIPGSQYQYRLIAVDNYDGQQLLASNDVLVRDKGKIVLESDAVTLEAGYPNPFNPSFVVPFTVHSPQNVRIELYDLTGKRVKDIANGYYTKGHYELRVDCGHLATGVYLLRTQVDDQQSIQRMLLTK